MPMQRTPTAMLALALASLLGACEAQGPGSDTRPADGGPAPAASASDTSEVVAVVDGTPIRRSLLDAYAVQRRGPDGKPLPVKQLLDELIAQELLLAEARRKGLDRDPQVRRRIELQTRNILAMAALKARMDAEPVTDEELRRIYEEMLVKQKRREFKARHILVKDEATARRLIAELDKGADFAKLAREHSVGPSGKQGGELGWFSPSQMVKPFADAVAALEKGQYTKEPVQTRFGWHVVQLEDVREIPPPDFEQVKDRLREVVQRQRIQRYLQELLAKAKIERKGVKEAPATTGGQRKDAGGERAAAD